MFAARGLRVVLQLVVVLGVAVEAEVGAAAGESALNDDGGSEVQRGLAVAVADVLEAKFVEEVGTPGLRVGELEGLLDVAAVERLRREGELTDAAVALAVPVEMVARGEGVDFAGLQIVAGGEVALAVGIGKDLREGRGLSEESRTKAFTMESSKSPRARAR